MRSETIRYDEKGHRTPTQLHYISDRISDRGNDGFEHVERMKDVLNCGLQRKGKIRRPTERWVGQRKC